MISADDGLHAFVIVVRILSCCFTAALGGFLPKIAFYLWKTERGEGREESPLCFIFLVPRKGDCRPAQHPHPTPGSPEPLRQAPGCEGDRFFS